MFGPAFLVNPVTEQLFSGPDAAQGKHTRDVYLPAGTSWYDFWTGKKYKGGQTLNADAPLKTMPLYVRAGSIVPMGPHMEYATEKPADVIELRIYSGANGQFELYEDENDNYNYEKGKYATIQFGWDDQKRELHISSRKGSFPGMPGKRTFNVILVSSTHGSGDSIATKIDKTVTYNGAATTVKM
jgi:alpha-D-xyloside xylohydrolase